LWKNIADPELSVFYYELMVSEAGHYKSFLQLAKTYMTEEYVEKRWRQLLADEAEVMKKMEVRGDRMH
jgi:tRNA-(ms[2]io[6]A)-hydroxylase